MIDFGWLLDPTPQRVVSQRYRTANRRCVSGHRTNDRDRSGAHPWYDRQP